MTLLEIAYDAAAEAAGVDVEGVAGKSRQHRYSQPRRWAWLGLRTSDAAALQRSYVGIGRAAGRDHSTVINQCKMATRECESGSLPDARRAVRAAREAVNAALERRSAPVMPPCSTWLANLHRMIALAKGRRVSPQLANASQTGCTCDDCHAWLPGVQVRRPAPDELARHLDAVDEAERAWHAKNRAVAR